MHHSAKLATCSYCGSRTLLRPTARDGHELACGSCGAPLHEMKWLKAPESTSPKSVTRKKPQKRKPKYEERKFSYSRKPKKEKRRKRFGFELLEEIWDKIEDVID